MRIIALLLMLTLVSCTGPSYMSEKDLIAYTRDESKGLWKQKNSSRYEISLYNKPTGLLVAQELGQSADSAKYAALCEKYGQYLYFILELSLDDQNPVYQSGTQEAFSEHLQTLSFRMDQFVNLTTASQDTIPVLDFVYPRMYGMSRSAALMFAFDTTGVLRHDYFDFNLSEFGMGTGSHSFRFYREDIKSAPRLMME